jgi:hypothetical protein
MSSPLHRDAALVDSSRPMHPEGNESRSLSSETILATVLGIVPMDIPAQKKQLAPPPVETEADGDGFRRRPTYKDSFGSVRLLVAAPAVEPLIQPPAEINETAPDEMDTGALPRLTYMDSVGMIRPLAAVVGSVRPSIPLAQNNESAQETTDAGAARRPLCKDSVDSVRFSAAAVRPRAQKSETNADEDDAVRIRRPAHMNRADSHPSAMASMPPRLPLTRDYATTLDEIETGAVCRPMYKDYFGSVRLPAAEIPPITNVPLDMKLKEVDEASDTFYDEDELNEDEAGSDNERARTAGEWIMVLPESKNRRRCACCMILVLVFVGAVVAVVFGSSNGGRTDPVSPQPPTSDAPQDKTTGKSQVAIEVHYDLHPEETGWTLRDSTGELIAGQSTGSFSTVSGTVVQTFDVAVGKYTFEMTDTFGDGICCRDGSGSFKIIVNGETIVSNDGQFGDTFQETFEAATPNS